MRINKNTLSAAEFLVAALIVLGHNVFRVLPNEVPILFVLGLASARVRQGRWTALGLDKPSSWRRTLIIAFVAVVLRLVLGEISDTITAHFWPPSSAPAGASAIKGNLLEAGKWLVIVWTFAAFGEEIAYRGYIINRGAEALGASRAAYVMAMCASAVLFGYGHYYKGPSGIIDDTIAGLILGGAYLVSGRNLWAPIIAHGLIDTIGIVVVFFGGT